MSQGVWDTDLVVSAPETVKPPIVRLQPYSRPGTKGPSGTPSSERMRRSKKDEGHRRPLGIVGNRTSSSGVET